MLKKLLEKLTGKERYYVQNLNFTTKSYVSNIFRAWEFVAGRKQEIRLESFSSHYNTEKGVLSRYQFGTIENLCVFAEDVVKGIVIETYRSLTRPNYKIELTPLQRNMQLTTSLSLGVLGMNIFLPSDHTMFPMAMGAIGYAATGSAGASNTNSYSYNVTVSGSDTLLNAGQNVQSGNNLSTWTYNSAALTQVIASNGDTGSAGFYGYNYVGFKIAPTTGTNSLAATMSTTNWVRGSAAVYSGVHQAYPIQNASVKNINSTTNSCVMYVTDVNSWVFSWFIQDNFPSYNSTPPSGYTQRSGLDSTQADSNGTIGSAGSKTISWGVQGTNRSSQLCLNFKPADTADLYVYKYQGNNGDYMNMGTSANIAMSFTVLQNVTIDKVALYATCGNGTLGTFKVEIYSGSSPASGTGTLEGTTGTLTASGLLPAYGSGNLAFTELNLSSPVSLVTGVTYYVKVTCLTGSSNDGIRWSRDTVTADFYFGNAWYATSGDTGWSSNANSGQGFGILAQAPVTSQVKTVVTVAQASVKTIAGVAIAAVKNLAGVSNT